MLTVGMELGMEPRQKKNRNSYWCDRNQNLNNNIGERYINALVDCSLLVEVHKINRSVVVDIVVLAKQFEMNVSLVAHRNIHVAANTDLVTLPCSVLEGNRGGDRRHRIQVVPHHLVEIHLDASVELKLNIGFSKARIERDFRGEVN